MKKTNLFLKSRRYALALGMALALFSTNDLTAQESGKVSPRLLNLSEAQIRASKSNSAVSPEQRRTISGITEVVHYKIVDNNYVIIELVSNGRNKALSRELKKLGAKEIVAYGGLVSCYFPIKAITSLENVKNMRYARKASEVITNSGKVTSQGDTAQRSSKVRTSYHLTGKGIKVGTLSDSYNALNKAIDGVKSGDLPGEQNPNKRLKEVKVLKDLEGKSDEGRAMMEIIHDVAPGAELSFHTGFISIANFAKGIEKLADKGADIINDDVTHVRAPYFQDGLVSKAVDKVSKKHGVLYFTSAGNHDNRSYESNFRPEKKAKKVYMAGKEKSVGNYLFHDFNSGKGVDIFQEIEIKPQGRLWLALQWDNSFASNCKNCPGAEADLDVFLSKKPDVTKMISRTKERNIGNDAVDVTDEFINEEKEAITLYIAIGKRVVKEKKNPNPTRIKYFPFVADDVTFKEYSPNSGTVIGHHNASSAICLGAANYHQTPEFGSKSPIVATYSSLGGTKIYFDKKGVRYKKPKSRVNPDFVAPDGANTTFFGSDITQDKDKHPNFNGTSAAAPHAAAVAALLLELKGDSKTPLSISEYMSTTAIDMDDPLTSKFDKGYDLRTGTGLIDAKKAADKMIKDIGVKRLKITEVCTKNPKKERKWKVNNPNTFTVRGTYKIVNTDVKGKLVAKKGVTYIKTKTQKSNKLEVVYKDGDKENVKISSKSKGIKCKGGKGAVTQPGMGESVAFSMSELYPNPVNSEFNLDFEVGEHQAIVLKLYDVNGKLCKSQTIGCVPGTNTVVQNIEDLNSGLYYLSVESSVGEKLGSSKLLKK